MFGTFTDSVKVTCKLTYRYIKCTVQYILCTFSGSVKVACIIPYMYSKCSVNVSEGQ